MNPSQEISLYVHVPFCRKKCDYCDFFSLGNNNCAELYTLRENFLDSVRKEVQFYAHHYNVSKWKTVYIGGGTPSQLTVHQLSALLDGIFMQAPAASDAEVTVEVNPDDVSLELIQCLSRHGVNRISMGIQSFDQKALDAVQRKASAQSAMHALDLLQEHWNGRLSCDLIAGLPCHSRKSFEKGVSYLCSCEKVDHISLYTLTVEDGTPLARKIDSGEVMWSQEKADEMWIYGRDILEASGFSQY